MLCKRRRSNCIMLIIVCSFMVIALFTAVSLVRDKISEIEFYRFLKGIDDDGTNEKFIGNVDDNDKVMDVILVSETKTMTNKTQSKLIVVKRKIKSKKIARRRKFIKKKKKKKKKPKIDYMNSLKNQNLYQNITNDHNFTFVRGLNDVCSSNPDLYVLSIVHTAPKNFIRRNVVRENWGREIIYKKLRIKTIFFMGISNEDNVTESILQESDKYGDIVVQDFVDSYRNLTFKAMAWMQWIDAYCPNVSYILKLDDDAFVNVFGVVDFLRNNDKKLQGKGSDDIMCYKRPFGTVFRHSKSKWKVTTDEYKDDIYPSHCPGVAVIIGRNLVSRLHNESYYVPFFWIDDVYFTGLLTTRLSINITDISKLFAPVNHKKVLIEGKKLFTHSEKSGDIRLQEYWKTVLNKYLKK